MSNTNNIQAMLQHRYRDITITDKVTGESKDVYRAVNLRAADFPTRDDGRQYGKNILKIAPVLMAYAIAADDKDESRRIEAKNNALEAVQRLVNFIAHAGEFKPFTVQKADINYIIRLAYVRKLDRTGKTGVKVEVKSKSAIQALFEDVCSYRLNGKRVPKVTVSDTAQTALDKLELAEKKAAEETKAATKKPTSKVQKAPKVEKPATESKENTAA